MRYTLLTFACLFLAFNGHASNKDWELYSQQPLIEQPAISPNGQVIATVYNTPDGPTVALAPFATMDFSIVARLKKNRDRIDFIRWSGNKYIIIGTSYPEYINGQHFRVSRLYSVDVNTGNTLPLSARRFQDARWYRIQSFNLVSALKNDEEHALVATYDDKDRAYSVFKVSLSEGSFDKIQNNYEDISSWTADQAGIVRIGVSTKKEDDKFIYSIWYRASADQEMTKIHTHVVGDDNTFSIIGLNQSGDKAYVMSDRETGRESLWLYDINRGEFESLIMSNDRYDLSGGLKNSQGELIGTYYYDDFLRTHYFDDADSQLEKLVSGSLPGKEISIASYSADKKRLLVAATSDSQVPVYYWFDLAKRSGGAWLSQYPYLMQKTFSAVENITFEASDGMTVSGYLTMPNGVKKPKLIVMPHGGPHSRDYKYFNPFVQFLANSGYAVLQINFRGSSGFGSAFEVAGYYQWGKRMQQDVYDGMDWLISTGRVSEDKACAVGASYGGYWALTAAFQQPDRFDCIVSIAGISDVQDLVSDRERRDYFSGHIINDDNEETVEAAIAELADVSAINHISKIKAPMLLIHGTKDTRVPYAQSKEFYEQAKRKIDIEYIEVKDGTHFFDDNESNQIRYKAISEFLSDHL